MSLKSARVLGPEKGRCWSQVCGPEKGRFVAGSSLWQPGGCGLEMPAGTRGVAVRLADWPAGSSLGPTRRRVSRQHLVSARRSRRPTVRSVAAWCECVLPMQVGSTVYGA
jgi:hypothetical protein